jgi:protein SCO1/2
MSTTQRNLMMGAWGLMVVAMVAIVASGRLPGQTALPHEGQIASFALTNQDGQPFDSNQLAGKVWIADFIFTRCPGPCPIMSRTLSELQRKLPHQQIRFVSFTLDPKTDTPEVLRAYRATFNGDSLRWLLLTGEKKALQNAARGMQMVALNDADGSIIHDQKFLLIDATGEIRGRYDSRDPDDVARLTRDADRLIDGGGQ